MAEHTKEPWATTPGDVHRYVAGGGQFIRDTQGVIIAEVFPCGSDPQRMAADAARIVACVNGYAELEEAAREVLRPSSWLLGAARSAICSSPSILASAFVMVSPSRHKIL